MKKRVILNNLIALTLLILFISVSTGCSVPIEVSEVNTEVSTEVSTEINTEDNSGNSVNDSLTILEANIKSWKLGNDLILYAGSNRTYDWYIDQAHTGDHSMSNCGPTSVAMAAKWADEAFEGTPEKARDAFRPEGGWWYSDDIEESLKLFKVDYDSILIEDINTLRSIIDSGRIAIINNSMGYITRETDTTAHTNRFYDFDSGHYLILKGYALVDQYTYFEVYDPNNWDMTYEDGTPMGKDRYYEASVFMDSIENWYPYAIVINSEN